MRLLLVPAAAFALTALLHLAALRLFPKAGLLDFPERYGLSRKRLPYPAGILGVLVFLLLSPALLPWNFQTVGLLFAVVLLAATCFTDDRRQLPFSVRLCIQAAAAAAIFLTGTRIFSITNPLEAWTGIAVIPLDRMTIAWPLFSDPSVIGLCFTVFWLMLTMNALNWLDGIPGQVSVLSAIGFIVIGCLALSGRVDQPALALLSFTVAGIAFASFLFDFKPLVIPGDTGAMFYGLLLGTLTIYAGGKLATAFLVLGVPLIDLGLVILRRFARGRSPFRGSMRGEHLHHRLLEAGMSKRGIVALTAVIGITFGVTALFLSTTQKFIAALAMILLLIVLSFVTDRIIGRRTSPAR